MTSRRGATADPGRRRAAPGDGKRSPGLDERIAALGDSLGAAERHVAAFFAERRDEVPFMSAAQIADALETSNATVVRAAQALGYPGLRALKSELAEALRTTGKRAARLGAALDQLGADADHVFDHIFAFDIQVLEQARKTLAPGAFGTAVDELAKAERIAVFAPGFYQWVAQHFVMCLHRFGRDAYVIASRGAGVAEELAQLRRGDVVVAIAYEKPIEEFAVALDRIDSVGCPLVLITDALELALEGKYVAALSAGRGGANMQPTAVVTLAIVEALVLALAGRDPARVAHALHEREELGHALSRRT